MSDLNKNILITPNKGKVDDPIITFTGRNNTSISLKVLDEGTVSFEGVNGQLLGIAETGINLSDDLKSNSISNIIDGFTINGGIY